MNTDAYKTALQEERETLMEELGPLAIMDPMTEEFELVPQNESGEETESDENDLADKFEDFAERGAKVDVLETRIHDVEDALAKIEDGTFGTCEKCEKPIEEDRLEANPAARTCMACMNTV